VVIIDPEALVGALLVPIIEVYDEVNALSVAHGGDAEEIFDVQHAETTNLDVITKQVCGGAKDRRWRSPFAPDDVVCDKPMTSQNELDRALAFADSALAGEQKTDSENIDQNAVQRGGGG